MRILHDWPAARFDRSVLSIGNFDGVHRGHQAILSAGSRRAREAGVPQVVLTFEPHPSALLTPDRVPATLTPLPAKLELLRDAGVDAVVLIQPTPEFLAISAERFVTDVIVDRFHPVAMVEGPTFGFGQHRRGDVRMLAAAGKTHGFQVEVVEPVRVNMGGHPETIVSSSLVRHLLSSGSVDTAELCLGRPYTLYGEVEHGHARGRTIGFPTANLRTTQLVPAEGVYACRATLFKSVSDPASMEMPAADGKPIAAAVSVGRNPTFNDRELSVEAFLLDFQGDVYGRRMKLEFLAWIRGQQKYPTPEALARQIEQDVQRTRDAYRERDITSKA